MATGITNYQCPACNGPLHFDSSLGKLKCDYCDSIFSVEEIEKFYKDKEAASVAAQAKIDEELQHAQQEAQEFGESWPPDEASNLKAYNCPSCGAELICDETTAATSCPYCGNPTIVPSQLSGSLRPEYIIPFKLDKARAVESLKNLYKGKKLLPNAFSDNNHIEEIKGVYVPFWLCDCNISGEMNFSGTKSRSWREGDYLVTETDHFILVRDGSIAFKLIPADASTKMPDDLMDSLEPYDYKELTKFSTAFLPGYFADKFDVSSDQSKDRIKNRAVTSALSAYSRTVAGFSGVAETDRKLSFNDVKMHYALLPVWLLNTKWNDQSFLFAMNGQTGKFIGDLPIDKKKYWKYFFIIALAVAAGIFLLALL